jgi:hypothetical protein
VKPLAPYGEHLQQNASFDAYHKVAIIFMGPLSLEKAQDLRSPPFEMPYVLCLPPYTSPTHFTWPLKNTEVYLVDTGHSSVDFVRSCSFCFFAYGATKITYISRKQSFIFNKELKK